jgi:hypothetical protein
MLICGKHDDIVNMENISTPQRIAAAQRVRCFAPCPAQQERRGVLDKFQEF